MNYRMRGEFPREGIITINGEQFKCPRAGWMIIQHKL